MSCFNNPVPENYIVTENENNPKQHIYSHLGYITPALQIKTISKLNISIGFHLYSGFTWHLRFRH